MAGAIAGAIIGGNVGQVVAQGTQFGLGTYFLRYSREYEKQADLLGVQLMARAGYNPLDLMHMFQTIEKQGGGGGPQFLSDHPNPGNREVYITEEASHLRIEGQAGDSREFARVQDRLRSMSPAPTTEQVDTPKASRRPPSRDNRRPTRATSALAWRPRHRGTRAIRKGTCFASAYPTTGARLRRASR